MINLRNSEQAAALYALVVSLTFAFLAYYDTDAEVYLFPRIIAIALALLSVILLIANTGSKSPGAQEKIVVLNFPELLPGLVIGFLYFLLLETLGFYMSSFLAFLAILMVYGQRKALDVEALKLKVAVAAGFMLILFLLFWNGLHVRTPTGWFF